MSDHKIGYNKKNNQFTLSHKGMVDSCGDKKAGMFTDGDGRYKYAKVLGFYKKENINWAFCQNVIAKTMQPNGKCSWFSVRVASL